MIEIGYICEYCGTGIGMDREHYRRCLKRPEVIIPDKEKKFQYPSKAIPMDIHPSKSVPTDVHLSKVDLTPVKNLDQI